MSGYRAPRGGHRRGEELPRGLGEAPRAGLWRRFVKARSWADEWGGSTLSRWEARRARWATWMDPVAAFECARDLREALEVAKVLSEAPENVQERALVMLATRGLLSGWGAADFSGGPAAFKWRKKAVAALRSSGAAGRSRDAYVWAALMGRREAEVSEVLPGEETSEAIAGWWWRDR